jgi:SNF2 family DNA or RNA helicase
MSETTDRLEQYMRTEATSATISKGKALLNGTKVRLVDVGMGFAELDVKSENYFNTKYKINIRGFKESGNKIAISCTCPYNYGGLCKHETAAIIKLIGYLQEQQIDEKPVVYQMISSMVTLPTLSDELLKKYASTHTWKDRFLIKKTEILFSQNGIAELKVSYKKQEYDIKFIKNFDNNEIHTYCSCHQSLNFPLCEHKLAALLKIKEQYNIYAFEMMKDWTAEKNKLLAEYGFSLEDKIEGKFDFKVSEKGQISLIKKDPSIQKISQFQDWQQVQPSFFKPQNPAVVEKGLEEIELKKEILYILFPHPQYSYSFIDTDVQPFTYQVGAKGKISYLKRLESYFHFQDEMPNVDETLRKVLQLRKRLESNWVISRVRKIHPGLTSSYNLYWEQLDEEVQQTVQEIIGKQIDILLPILADKNVYLPAQQVPQNNDYRIGKIEDLQQVQISFQPMKPVFYLKEDENFMILEAFVNCSGKMVALNQINTGRFFWLIENLGILYKWATFNDASVVRFFQSSAGKIKIRKSNFEGFFTDFILPLTENFEVEFQIDREIKAENLEFIENRIYLKEDEENLLIIPAYAYRNKNEEFEYGQDGRTSKVIYEDQKILLLDRNAAAEQETYEFLTALHPDFQYQTGQAFFYLPFKNVMTDGWLFTFFEALKEKEIRVFGFKELKKLRYNPNRANFRIEASSGIDWFDMKVEMHFGDQFVSLSEIKKALLKKQNYIELKDGTLGLLPQEWLAKHADLFKFGRIDGDSLQLSKLHFTLIDDLSSQIDSAAIQQEILEKKQKLLNFKEIKNLPLPKNVKADLRQYQAEGYKWLHFLDEFGWGGCLADDMGLGKTLQILTFLQEQRNRFPNAITLVVMPTTLIFNWQAEAEKFCPDLKVYIHRGISRAKDTKVFKKYDLILTTYGTMRSDIDMLKDYVFHYVVLDESQAIKNPASQTSKAVKLLKAKNRLAMTGTPIENNTFDLYSQFDFLNPGFLGSEEFFQSEFATPIDKHQDVEKTAQLRKMVYPFMLKRTKEEVAKDLPDKTETILFCEMDKKQRKVYETFRESYRQKIVEKMTLEGKEKSAMLILEALLKLRQICDSPALLSDEGEFPADSAKLDELIREIEENASNHKILIFSQFLKMLELIRKHLEKENIIYEYLDGSTSDRAAKVKRFQGDKACRVFLISLKAGGVGINLTEADYVYLVDPWWNPAVEQQAIDRTHRIGQTKKVFAYKMICKDTIEEKILTLQARKKSLATDLISAEAGFIKKLSQDDIVSLFS